MIQSTSTPKDSRFIENLDVSMHILAGNIEEAQSIIKNFDKETLHSVIDNCRKILKKSKHGRLSSAQKLCLTIKIELCKSLLEEYPS